MAAYYSRGKKIVRKMVKNAFSQESDFSEMHQDSVVILIEPRSLTRQCLFAWLEPLAPETNLKTFDSLAGAVDDQAADVGLIIWSIGASSISSGPLHIDLTSLKEHYPKAALVILTDREDAADVRAALRLGVSGYLPTSLDRGEALEVLRFVRAGGTYVPASALLDGKVPCSTDARPCTNQRPAKTFDRLTPREAAVVERLRLGKPNKVIAHELDISESTVKVFVHRILNKLGAVNRTEVAYLAQQQADVMKIGSDPRL